MPQINLQVTAEFAKALKIYMQKRHIATKSQALRQAVMEAVDQILMQEKDDGKVGIEDLLGIAEVEDRNHKPRFASDDDLWS